MIINCSMCKTKIEKRRNNHKFCNECNRKRKNNYMKEYYQKNKDKPEFRLKRKEYMKEYNKKYEQEHKEELKEYKKEYRSRPGIRIREKEKNKEWKKKHKKEIKEYNKEYNQRIKDDPKFKLKNQARSKKYYYENKDNPKYKLKKKVYDKKYKKLNPEKRRKINNKCRRKKYQTDKNFKIISNLRSSFWRTLKYYTKTGKIMVSKLYGVSYKAIIEHYEKNKLIPEDLSNYDNHHIKPLFTFNFVNPDGSTNLEEIKKAWRPENLMLVTKEEHREIHRKLNHNLLK